MGLAHKTSIISGIALLSRVVDGISAATGNPCLRFWRSHGFARIIGNTYLFLFMHALRSSISTQFSSLSLAVGIVHLQSRYTFSPTYPVCDSERKMAISKALIAASVGSVQGLRDQGVLKANHLHNVMAKAMVSVVAVSSSVAAAVNSSSSSLVRAHHMKMQMKKQWQAEESLRQVMYLSSWAPN